MVGQPSGRSFTAAVRRRSIHGAPSLLLLCSCACSLHGALPHHCCGDRETEGECGTQSRWDCGCTALPAATAAAANLIVRTHAAERGTWQGAGQRMLRSAAERRCEGSCSDDTEAQPRNAAQSLRCLLSLQQRAHPALSTAKSAPCSPFLLLSTATALPPLSTTANPVLLLSPSVHEHSLDRSAGGKRSQRHHTRH